MDARSEIREFLTSRRARLNVTDVGLPDYGASANALTRSTAISLANRDSEWVQALADRTP
jgi:hypothetical protein